VVVERRGGTEGWRHQRTAARAGGCAKGLRRRW